MGMHKHGKTSAKSKSNEQYKAAGRYAANKQRKAERHQKQVERFAERRGNCAG